MRTTKLTSIAAVVLAATAYSQSAFAEPAFSANVGLVSEYHFRGILQQDSASASAGLDFENGGFYLGTWVADVGLDSDPNQGMEIDFYGGYGFEFDGGLGLSIGYTTYQYTGDFDSSYNEVNLGLSYEMVSFEYSIGTHEDDVDLGITESDYTFLGVTIEGGGFYATYGQWGDDFDGDYFEVGYGTEIGGFDAGVTALFSGSDLNDDETIFFTLGKSFDL